MSGKLNIFTITPEQHNRWSAYVGAHQSASIYHSIEWKQVVERTFGHETYYLAAADDQGQFVGALPLVRLKSHLFGDYMVSLPFVNFGGALGDSEIIELALMKHACRLGESLGVAHIQFRDTEQRQGSWQVRTDKVRMSLVLPDDPQELWKSVGSKRRTRIRRPQKQGVVIRRGHHELLNDFYDVFSRNKRDLGTPVYAKRFFSDILRTFPTQTYVFVAYLEDKPVGAAFLIGHRERLEIPWACTLKEVNRFAVNMLLYWETLSFAIEKGFRVFDFGRSTTGSGTYEFKKQWGAQEEPLYWHHWMREGEAMPSLTPTNPKYQLAISLWRRLPVAVTRWPGPSLVKNLP